MDSPTVITGNLPFGSNVTPCDWIIFECQRIYGLFLLIILKMHTAFFMQICPKNPQDLKAVMTSAVLISFTLLTEI